MVIDDRKNSFMLGLTISLFSHIQRPILYILALILINWLLQKWIIYLNVIADGDASAFNWIFLGFGIFGYTSLIIFLISFAFTSLIYQSMKQYVFKVDKPTPFFMVLLLSFIATCLIGGLYL